MYNLTFIDLQIYMTLDSLIQVFSGIKNSGAAFVNKYCGIHKDDLSSGICNELPPGTSCRPLPELIFSEKNEMIVEFKTTGTSDGYNGQGFWLKT
jgi:hypothetical protein